jgi:hypothetical protein
MRRAALLLAVGTMLSVFAPSAAQGKGWWSTLYFSSPYLVPGQRATAGTDVLFGSVEEAANQADTANYVYLIRDLDWRIVEKGAAPVPDGRLVEAAAASLTRWSGGTFEPTFEPAIREGRLCCTRCSSR